MLVAVESIHHFQNLSKSVMFCLPHILAGAVSMAEIHQEPWHIIHLLYALADKLPFMFLPRAQTLLLRPVTSFCVNCICKALQMPLQLQGIL
jgi:hypothetical protein